MPEQKKPKAVAVPKGEVAAPETFGVGNQASKSNPFLNSIEPSDSVLRARGGVDTLEIYKELLRDDQVRSTFQQRRTAVTQAELIVDPGGEDAASKAAAEALKENLARLRWDDITDKALYSVFYGWGVAEVIWEPVDNLVAIAEIKVRDRARFRFGRDGTLYLRSLTGQNGGLVPMPERKFWTLSTGADNDDEPYGLGIAHSIYWPVWFKRNDIKFWLTFLERFGQPTSIVKIPAGQINDPTVVENAVSLLKNIATDAGLVVPDNVVVELLEAARTGAADYDAMRQAMDAAIAKVVLSQTMTTDDGSSLAQAKVHQGVADHVVKSDADFVCESFNRTVVRWWTEWNFPNALPPRVWRQTEPPEDLNARALRDSNIIKLGYEPTEEYILETYGDGWVKKKEQPAPAMGALGPNGNIANPDFAEGEAAAVAALKGAKRGDQAAILQAAVNFANDYETILGARVGALVEAAQDSGDYETFREKLDSLLAEVPAPQTTDAIVRGNFVSRLLGAFRHQRPQ